MSETAAGPATETATETLRARDERVFSYWRAPNAVYLREASRRSGRKPLALVGEYLRLSRGPGRMTLPEYVQLGLWSPALGDTERRRFITNTLHWPITHRCCDMTWQATTEDCWLCARVLEGSGIPLPRTLGVIDRGSGRSWPGTRVIRSAGELRDFTLAHVRDGAAVFAPVRYQSMDVAITPGGPKLIEINTGGGFDLPQLASGRGFLSDEVQAFFGECGVRLRR